MDIDDDIPTIVTNDNEELEDDEFNELQDWGNFLQSANIQLPGINNNNTKLIPSKGNKGFEPNSNNYDNLLLQNKRQIMYLTIENSLRQHSQKSHIEGFLSYYNDIDNNEELTISIPRIKGNLLTGMGINKGTTTYLFFEEALYLIERGNLETFLITNNSAIPMSLQMSYGILIRSSKDYEKYFAYNYLKRQGYILKRPELMNYNPNESIVLNKSYKILLQKSLNFINSIINKIPFFSKILNHFSWANYYKNLLITKFSPLKSISGDLKFDYNVWKPNSKSKLPDYQLKILNINQNDCLDLKDLEILKNIAVNDKKIIFGLFDNGLINFIRLNLTNIGESNIYLKQKKRKVRR